MAWIGAHAPPDAIVATTHRTNATCSRAVAPYFHLWRSIRNMHIGCSKLFPCHMSLSTSSSSQICHAAMLFPQWRAIRPLGASCMKSITRESTSTRLGCSNEHKLPTRQIESRYLKVTNYESIVQPQESYAPHPHGEPLRFSQR